MMIASSNEHKEYELKRQTVALAFLFISKCNTFFSFYQSIFTQSIFHTIFAEHFASKSLFFWLTKYTCTATKTFLRISAFSEIASKTYISTISRSEAQYKYKCLLKSQWELCGKIENMAVLL